MNVSVNCKIKLQMKSYSARDIYLKQKCMNVSVNCKIKTSEWASRIKEGNSKHGT